MLESASLEKVLPDAAQNSEAGDVSPCRSPSTPRHLRYRQPGGKAVTHTQRVSEPTLPTLQSSDHSLALSGREGASATTTSCR